MTRQAPNRTSERLMGGGRHCAGGAWPLIVKLNPLELLAIAGFVGVVLGLAGLIIGG